MMPVLSQVIRAMMHSPVHNYVIPGLTSWLVGEKGERGFVRLFTMSRDHEEPISPHSHRFDFTCQVLSGSVRNRIWHKSPYGDLYQSSEVRFEGAFGKHILVPQDTGYWEFDETTYATGEWYSMDAGQVHSIFFARASAVLFFEGPPVAPQSIVLEPVVDGEVIPLMRTDPWMFRRTT